MCQNRRAVQAFLSIMMLLVWIVSACAGNLSLPAVSIHSPLLGSYNFTPFSNHQPTGTLVLGDTGFPTSVNPLFAANRFDMEVASALWAAPVIFDNHFHVQPDQLTEVPLPENGGVQDGGKTIIMHLRHTLRWSDGQPILASDFAYWWHLNQDPATGAISMAGYDEIASIETPDNFTVILHLKQSFGPYLSYLPYAAPEHAWRVIQPIDLQNRQDIFLAPAVTDGPYKLASFAFGQRYILVPNTFYTSTTFHGPFLAQLIYRAYLTPEALAVAVRAGKVDVAEGYTEDELSSLGGFPTGEQLQITAAAAYEHLDFNLGRAVFQDLRVRQAVQLALDRCGIIQHALHMPDCSRLVDQVEPLPSLFNDASIHAPEYNPSAARQLLAADGWSIGDGGWLYKQGQRFVVHLVTTTGNALRAAVAQRIQTDLRAVGIQVQLTFYNLGTFFGLYNQGGILATGNYDLAMFGYSNSPEPDDENAVFASSQIPSAANPALGNYGRISDTVIDQGLAQGRAAVPFTTRVQAYHLFLERLANQVYVIPLYTAENILVVSTRLKNAVGNPNTIENNWNIADWWVSS